MTPTVNMYRLWTWYSNDFIAVDSRTESSTNRLDYVIVASTLCEMIRSLSLATVNSNSFSYIMPT
jgi:hypothetical protein